MKFRKATKKIMAVAAASAVASASVFGAAANYPQNFVENDKLEATVVYGSEGSADLAAAQSIVSDLESDYASGADNVVITYRTASEDGTSVKAIKDSKELNYGEFIENVSEDIDSDEVSFLGDYTFENGKDNEEYEQEVVLKNGEFNFGTRDEDGQEDASAHIWYEDGDVFAEYTLDFDSSVSLTSGDADQNEKDFVGEKLQIMGQEFIISEISEDGSTGNIDSLTLLGGADKVALGEGDEVTVTYEGKTYSVKAETVDGGSGSNDGEAVVSVNGVTKTISEFETKDVAGVTLAVTDIVGSDRDSVKGYVELIVGGVELSLTSGSEVEVNDEKVSDYNEDYKVVADLGSNGFSTFRITYEVANDVVLEKGEALIDPLFNAFELTFDGTNDVDYSNIEFKGGENTDELDVTAELSNGENLDWFTVQYDGYEQSGSGATNETYLKGSDGNDEHRIYFLGSNASLTAANPLGLLGTTITINVSDDNGEDSSFYVYEAEDEQYLFTVSNFDDTDRELDVDEEIEGTSDDQVSVDSDDVIGTFNTALEVKDMATLSSGGSTAVVDLSAISGNQAVINLANEVLFDFSEIENVGNYITISLDSDADGDEDADVTANTFNVSMSASTDSDNDDEVDVEVTSTANFVNTNPSDLADISADDDDTRVYVTAYGTKVKVDAKDKDMVTVMTPDEQVRAEVSLVFGQPGEVKEVVVAASEADAKVAELEAEGSVVIGQTSTANENVEVSVSAPVMDSDVSSMEDLIVVGGPAVNSVARELLNIETYSIDQAGVEEGQYVHQYFESKNVVLVYGYSAADTTAGVNALNAGNTKFN